MAKRQASHTRTLVMLPGDFAEALGDLLKVKPPQKGQSRAVKSKPRDKPKSKKLR